jgi:hypothetical protein
MNDVHATKEEAQQAGAVVALARVSTTLPLERLLPSQFISTWTRALEVRVAERTIPLHPLSHMRRIAPPHSPYPPHSAWFTPNPRCAITRVALYAARHRSAKGVPRGMWRGWKHGAHMVRNM